MSNEKYFEPNAAPEEVQKSKQLSKRKMIIRFETENDVRLFTEKTGINLVRNKLNRIDFPTTNKLEF
jgi:hypothetical protein